MNLRDQVKRNREITEKWVGGMFLRELSALYNLSISRVYNIILSNKNYMELEKKREAAKRERRRIERGCCPVCNVQLKVGSRNKFCSNECRKIGFRTTHLNNIEDKYETAKYLRSVETGWSEIAEILSYASTDSCIISLRRYAEQNNRIWPLPIE